MTANFESLIAHIMPMSVASTFGAACREWQLFKIEYNDDFDNCPCGQDIKELCYIRNSLTGHETYVGNVCINRFMGISTGNLFEGLRRIAKDHKANANEDLIIHSFKFGYIHESEYKFLMDTRRKRNLSPKQLAWKEKINRRILHQTVVRRV